jgi:hypothetical protein
MPACLRESSPQDVLLDQIVHQIDIMDIHVDGG